jgi:hypothetical protein
MNPVAHVAHQIQGRVRIKVPSRQGDTEYFSVVHESLLSYPSLEEIRVNPMAGSIIINHREPSLEALKQFVHEKQLFILVEEHDKTEVLLQRASSGLESFDSGIKKMSGGELDLSSVLFIILMGLAIRQLLIGNTVGPASTILWQALGLVLANKISN